jgi:hypothetical protein
VDWISFDAASGSDLAPRRRIPGTSVVNTNPSKLRFGFNGLALVLWPSPANNIVFALVLAAVGAAMAHINLAVANFAVQVSSSACAWRSFNMIPSAAGRIETAAGRRVGAGL